MVCEQWHGAQQTPSCPGLALYTCWALADYLRVRVKVRVYIGLLMRNELKFMQRPHKGHFCVCGGVGGDVCVRVSEGESARKCICPDGSGEIHILNAHS